MSGWRKRGKNINMDDKFKDLNIADVFTLRYHRTEDGNYQQTYTPADFDLMQECVDRALGEYTQSMEVENNMLRARNDRLEAREWVGLPEEESERLIHNFKGDPWSLLDEVNARLKEKNT